MAKRNTSGESSGRRGSSRNSGGSSSNRRKSDGPFKKSGSGDSRRSGKSDDFKRSSGRGKREDSGYSDRKDSYNKRDEGGSSFSSGRKSSFRKSDSGEGRSEGRFKKFDKPYGRKNESSEGGDKPFRRSSSSRSEGGAKKSFGRREDSGSERPFKRRSSDRSEGGERKSFGRSEDSGEARSSSRFKKFDKPYGKRDEGSSDGDKPFRRSSSSRSEGGAKKSFGRRDSSGSERPFKRRSSDRAEGGERKSFGRSEDSGEARSSSRFKKFDKPYDNKGESSDGDKPFKKRSFSDRTEGGEKRSFGKRDDQGSRSSGRPRGDRKEKGGDSEERGFFKKSNARFSKKPSGKSNYEEKAPAQTEKVRLNKFIANSGVCSRREADELITMGLIAVNGTTITELGYKVNPGDEVRYENKVLKAEKPVYILMNKPKGFLTTTDDPQERNTVMHILGGNVKERVYPVGRLDRNTTGLLLLTNDGDLAEKLMHPSYGVKKIYKVELDRPFTKADFQTVSEGVLLDEGRAMVDDLVIVSPDGRTVGLEIHIGWNRVVRRIFEALNYEVLKLDRTIYAGLDKKDLGRGQWRFLGKDEIIRLKHLGAK